MSDTLDAAFLGSSFAFELKGVELAYFTSISGIGIEFEVITFKETSGKVIVERKRPGRPKYGEVTLKRGFTTSKALQDWFTEVVEAAKPTTYKDASIVVYGRDQKEVARFNLENCWPSKLSVSDLSAGSDDTIIEEVTIQHDFLDWA